MPYFKFGQNDIFYNRIETHPQVDFLIWNGSVYYNNNGSRPGVVSGLEVNLVPTGNISLYELNVDRPAGELIYPFVTKAGSLTSFKTVSLKSFNADFQYGDTMTGSYPLNAGISREYLDGGTVDVVNPGTYGTIVYKPRLLSLKNTLNYYKYLSEQYAYSSSFGDKAAQNMSFISIPSIFYGSSIEKGSVNLKFYVTGALVGEINDENRNGNLVQIGPSGSTGSGSVAGVVLYNEGFILLTGSWELSSHTEDYIIGDPATTSKWAYFATTGTFPTQTVPSSSFAISFRGTNYVPVKTMLAQAPKGYLNHSNNPSYIEYGQSGSVTSPHTGSTSYIENQNISIKNMVSSSYPDPTGTFKKQTWISRIGIYDKDKNLIGIAKVANPVKKTEEHDFTFKLKLDF